MTEEFLPYDDKILIAQFEEMVKNNKTIFLMLTSLKQS